MRGKMCAESSDVGGLVEIPFRKAAESTQPKNFLLIGVLYTYIAAGCSHHAESGKRFQVHFASICIL